tara:strand:- start:35960 stop:36427 length:468 start_codon:yes stop_codon:yes gene_type:complete
MNNPIIDINDKYYCLFPSYHLGNGLSVCKRGKDNMPENESIAFIHPDRKIAYRNSKGRMSLNNIDIEKYIQDYIIKLALTDDRDISVSQDVKVFNERPAISKGLRLELHRIHDSVKEQGYSGVLPNGNIVDRRIFPNAIPMQKNSMFNIPKPEKL